MDYLAELKRRRRENLLRLLNDYPTQRDFSNATGLAVAQVSHILTGFREMGDGIARQIESALNLPLCRLDQALGVEAPASDLPLLPADQFQLLIGYRQMSLQHQAVVRELVATYAKLDQQQQ